MTSAAILPSDNVNIYDSIIYQHQHTLTVYLRKNILTREKNTPCGNGNDIKVRNDIDVIIARNNSEQMSNRLNGPEICKNIF